MLTFKEGVFRQIQSELRPQLQHGPHPLERLAFTESHPSRGELRAQEAQPTHPGRRRHHRRIVHGEKRERRENRGYPRHTQLLRGEDSAERDRVSDDDIGLCGRSQDVFITLAHHGGEVADDALATAPGVHDVGQQVAIVKRDIGPGSVKGETGSLHFGPVELAGGYRDWMPAAS